MRRGYLSLGRAACRARFAAHPGAGPYLLRMAVLIADLRAAVGAQS